MENNQESLLVNPTVGQFSGQSPTPNTNINNLEIDLENWMGKLPECLTSFPIIYLAIPGSHNSFSYSISPDLGVSPDSPQLVQHFGKRWMPFTKRIIYNWSRGQQQSVMQQLYLGIRYFDVRLVVHKNNILISHGFYGGQIDDFLNEINLFLTNHPKEIVILDFQHFYDFETYNHVTMVEMMLNIFDYKICRRQRRMRENTLDLLRKYGNQVIIIYRHETTRHHDIFWPSGTWPTPWPNKIKVDELIDCLNEGLSDRAEGMGFVSQGIVTPTPKYVGTHMFGSLLKLSVKVNKKVVSWLESKHIGAHGVNVIICDFVERYDFCSKVIKLNYKGIYNP